MADRRISRRVPRLIANPITTALLFVALAWDISRLPGDPWAPEHSQAAVLFRSLLDQRPASQPPGRGIDAIIFKQGRDLHLRNMRTEPSWGDIATVMSDRPANAALLSGPDPLWHGRGLWAITTRTREFRVSMQCGSAFNQVDQHQARELFINEMVSPEWAESPRLLERFRREDFTLRAPVWSGYLHNALALIGLGLLGLSLAWLPRTPGFFRDRRAARRLRRGLCPHCAYPLAGLAICPECGTTIVWPPRGVSQSGGDPPEIP